MKRVFKSDAEVDLNRCANALEKLVEIALSKVKEMNDPIDYDLLRNLLNKLEIKEFNEKDNNSKLMYILFQYSTILEKNTKIIGENREDINKLKKYIYTLENKIKTLEVNKWTQKI